MLEEQELLDGGKDFLSGEHLGFLADLLRQVDPGCRTIQSLGIVERVVQCLLDLLLLEDISFLVLDSRIVKVVEMIAVLW
eukprot:15359083-Ditylum_brightwellii.AAC.1